METSPSQAEAVLATAESRLRGLIALPHRVALEHAHRFGVSAHDARFLAIAEKLRSPLVTENARLPAAASSLTRSIAEARMKRWRSRLHGSQRRLVQLAVATD